MAVPKKKTSPSKRGQRRAHNALKPIQISYHKITGEPYISHNMSVDGYYGKRKVIEIKSKIATEAESDDSRT